MARKNVGSSKMDLIGKNQSPGVATAYFFNNNNSRTNYKKSSFQRNSMSDSEGSTPRTSPGLLAGHYAGCKWVEPPLPSALPPPPQHWMQKINTVNCKLAANDTAQSSDFTTQLKILLNVQA